MMVSECNVLLQRARIAVGIGSTLCLAAGMPVIVPRKLGLIGNVFARDDYFSNGTYIWVETRGTGWLVLSTVLLLVGIPVMAAGIHDYLRDSGEAASAAVSGAASNGPSSTTAVLAALADDPEADRETVTAGSPAPLPPPPRRGVERLTGTGKIPGTPAYVAPELDYDHDCTVSFDEIVNNSLIVSLTSPDLQLDGVRYLSFGFGFEAVPAEVDDQRFADGIKPGA